MFNIFGGKNENKCAEISYLDNWFGLTDCGCARNAFT